MTLHIVFGTVSQFTLTLPSLDLHHPLRRPDLFTGHGRPSVLLPGRSDVRRPSSLQLHPPDVGLSVRPVLRDCARCPAGGRCGM